MAAQPLGYKWRQQVLYLFQILEANLFAASMSWRAKLMDRHKHQIHSNYMLRINGTAMLTLRKDQKWIFLHHLHLQIKIISLDKDQIAFKKKY